MISQYRRRELLAAGLAATAASVFGGSRSALAEEKSLPLMTYGGRWEVFFRETIGTRFRKLGYEPVLDVGNGGKWAATLRTASKSTPPYSYVMINEIIGSILRSEGYFEPWDRTQIPNLSAVHPSAFVADGTAVTAMFAPIGIAYRTDMVSRPPKAWKDLWENKELKGQIGLYSLQNTGGYMFLLMISQIYGRGPFDFDAGFKKIEELGGFLQSDRGGGLSIYMSRGEIAVSIQDMAETLNLRRSGMPVNFVIPEEGMFGFDQTFSKVANGRAPKAAADFLNLMLEKDIQDILAREFSYLPVRTDVPLPADMTALGLSSNSLDSLTSFDWVEASKHRAEVAERWNRLPK